jgi:Na+-translocating ferredoxin:NAD+ oxidoreductase subunit B
MYDVYKTAVDIIDIIRLADVAQILPQIGVGAEIEAREYIDIWAILRYSLIFLVGMGAVFGFILAFAAKKFAIRTDPRIDEVNELLAHAHCGACGFAGCEQYAAAVVNDPEVSPALCIPAGERAALKIAELTGKKADIKEKRVARIMCGGGLSKASKRYKYEGVPDCRSAIISGGGDKSCVYGCIGYGTCEKVCPFEAIKMGKDGLPVVDEDKCVACGKCVAACPKKVIEIMPAAKAVLVACHSGDKAADTRSNCNVGCIACGICVKTCPFGAVSVENNLSRIDPEKCRVCGLCAAKCPTRTIADFIPRTKASINDSCIGCGICKKTCPVEAISGEPKQKHLVSARKCIGCGLCAVKCPVQAFDGVFNAEQVRAAKKKPKEAPAFGARV